MFGVFYFANENPTPLLESLQKKIVQICKPRLFIVSKTDYALRVIKLLLTT